MEREIDSKTVGWNQPLFFCTVVKPHINSDLVEGAEEVCSSSVFAPEHCFSGEGEN